MGNRLVPVPLFVLRQIVRTPQSAVNNLSKISEEIF
jgi:hypothetical protein